MDIKVTVREAPGDCYVIDLSGEIDVYTSPKVKDAIGELIDRGVYFLVIIWRRFDISILPVWAS